MIQIICILNTWLNGYEHSGDERARSSRCHVQTVHRRAGVGGNTRWPRAQSLVLCHSCHYMLFPTVMGIKQQILLLAILDVLVRSDSLVPSRHNLVFWGSKDGCVFLSWHLFPRSNCVSVLRFLVSSRHYRFMGVLVFPASSDSLPMKDFRGDKK